MGKLTVKPLSIVDFVKRLETEKGFSFARYGDGTFMSMMGFEGFNCDGAKVTKGQAKELLASILDPTIVHGIGDLAVGMGAGSWLEGKGIEIEWYDCNVMHTASLQGRLSFFVKWLKNRKTVMVGPDHLQRLRAFPLVGFIETHPTQAFEQLEELHIAIRGAVGKEAVDTVLISAGPAAPPLVSRIHKDFPHLNVIDTGSVWDAFVGKLSRKVFRKMDKRRIQELGKLNFGVDVGAWWIT